MQQRTRTVLATRTAVGQAVCFVTTSCLFVYIDKEQILSMRRQVSYLNNSSANVRNTHSLGFSVFKVSVIAIVTKAPAPCCSSAPQRTQVSLHRSTCSLVPILNESSACARTGVAGIPPAPVPAGDNLGREALQGEPEANRHQRLRRIPKQRGGAAWGTRSSTSVSRLRAQLPRASCRVTRVCNTGTVT